MRKVNKGTQPQELSDFLEREKPTNWDCIHDAENQAVYTICKEALLKEQCGLSGYTERIINANNVHIDHFKKKGMFREFTFNWNNFVLDEHNSNFGADYKDKNVKIEDYQFLINPNLEDPHEYLTYQIDGKIIPLNDLTGNKKAKAETTIRLFNLNYPKLVNQRNSLLNQIAECVNNLSPDEIISAFDNLGYISVAEFAVGRY